MIPFSNAEINRKKKGISLKNFAQLSNNFTYENKKNKQFIFDIFTLYIKSPNTNFENTLYIPLDYRNKQKKKIVSLFIKFLFHLQQDEYINTPCTIVQTPPILTCLVITSPRGKTTKRSQPIDLSEASFSLPSCVLLNEAYDTLRSFAQLTPRFVPKRVQFRTRVSPR